MANQKTIRINRRDFLKLAGLSLGAAALQSCGGAKTPPPQTLKMWWWGEQEAPGLEGWMKETIAKFKDKTGSTIEPTLQDTTVVISEFQTAAAAKNAPDLQFLWNGIYHMELVWLGYLDPLDSLIPIAEINATNPTKMSFYQGHPYRMGWYSAGPLYLYNKEMFAKAGLGDQPPKTWDDLMSYCDKLKTAGITPIVGGLKDGPWGEWYMGHGLGQNLDTPADAINLFIGDLDWREPRYWEHWGKLEELWKAGYLNNDMNSIDLYPGIDLFGNGKGAMTAVVTPLAASQAKLLGSSDKVGAMTFPVFGKGKMAWPIADCQGMGLCTQSKYKDIGAEFLRFMHDPERVNALYDQSKALPMDTGFDSSKVTDSLLKQIWQGWVANKDAVPYISDLMPVMFWNDAMFVNSQKIISGEYTGEQAGQNAYDVTQKWIQQNPDLVEKYRTWAKDLSL